MSRRVLAFVIRLVRYMLIEDWRTDIYTNIHSSGCSMTLSVNSCAAGWTELIHLFSFQAKIHKNEWNCNTL
jgi:hypothetical protein